MPLSLPAPVACPCRIHHLPEDLPDDEIRVLVIGWNDQGEADWAFAWHDGDQGWMSDDGFAEPLYGLRPIGWMHLPHPDCFAVLEGGRS